MLPKKYIGVEAENIYLIMHLLTDNEDSRIQPSIMSFTVKTAAEIFIENGIPEEYQKMYMVVNNNLSMAFQRMITHSINLCPAAYKFNRFKAREFVSGTELFVAYNSRYELSGKQVGFPYAFDFNNCYICDAEDVENFIIELREKGLFDNYIKSISEITHIMFESEFDSNRGKVKQLAK